MTEVSAQIGIRERNRLKTAAGTAEREAQFTRLVEQRARFVFRVAYSVLRNCHDAEDVVQETFLKIYRSKAWEEIEDEKAFLARAAWRKALEKLPRKRKETLNPEMASTEASPEHAAIAADWTATVHLLVDALPEELRQPLALSTVEQLTSREIAGIMRISEGTVRTRLMRARRILKQKLAAVMERRYER